MWVGPTWGWSSPSFLRAIMGSYSVLVWLGLCTYELMWRSHILPELGDEKHRKKSESG